MNESVVTVNKYLHLVCPRNRRPIIPWLNIWIDDNNNNQASSANRKFCALFDAYAYNTCETVISFIQFIHKNSNLRSILSYFEPLNVLLCAVFGAINCAESVSVSWCWLLLQKNKTNRIIFIFNSVRVFEGNSEFISDAITQTLNFWILSRAPFPLKKKIIQKRD